MDYSLVTQGLKWGDPSYGTPGGTVSWANWSRSYSGEAFYFSSGLTAQMVAEANEAMAAWEAYAAIDFSQTSDRADLNSTGLRIGMTSIDGPGDTLALARRANYDNGATKAAQIGIDKAEGWHIENGRVVSAEGESFYQIILHELGHVLGLGHYDGATVVMNSAVNNLSTLQPGDIEGIRFIYGPASGGAGVDFWANIRDIEVDGREGATVNLPGKLILVHYSVLSSANAEYDAGKVGFYLSRDATIDASDRHLGSLDLAGDTVPGPGQLNVATYVGLPSDLSPGTYWLGVKADDGNALRETNESNNFSAAFSFQVGGSASLPTSPALTTFPSAVVVYFLEGTAPTGARLTALAKFSGEQFNSYKAAGVSRAEIGPYEALGRGMAETAAFANKYSGETTSQFVAHAYRDVFERVATAGQIEHFNKQISYFDGLYRGAGIASDKATLLAKGAALGQMLGFAVLDESSGHSYIAAATRDLPTGQAVLGLAGVGGEVFVSEFS